MSEEFDFESIKNKALEQLKSGKPLLGKDGAFAPLLESILNAALEGEMDAHLSEDERMSGNRRNGKMQKQVQTSMGEVTVSTPRDRNSTFDPQFIKKRETILAEGVADRIIGLYALGNSTREISDWMEENLGNRVSAETISAITDRVLPEIKAWRSRSLDSVYPIVWMDAIHYKVMDDRGCAVTRAIYNVLALDSEGHKDLLGMYISKNEGANFWLNVLTDLQTRGVCDILIACVDGLKGFPDAIQSVFPDTIVWKIQCKLPPKTKRFCPLKTFNNAPLKSLDRWGYYYFSLFPSVCSHFTDTFSCQLNPVRRMYNTIHNGICYCRVSDCIIPIVRWQLRGDDDGLAPMSVLYYIEQDGSFLGIKVHKEEVIQYEQRAPFDSLEFRFQCAFYFCHLKRTHKFRSIRIICPYALLAGFIPHCCGKEALPGTG